MWIDPIVEELRTLRDQHAAQHGFDAGRMFEDICLQQDKMRAAGMRVVNMAVMPGVLGITAPANSLAPPSAPG